MKKEEMIESNGKRLDLNWFERKALWRYFGKNIEKEVRKSLGFEIEEKDLKD